MYATKALEGPTGMNAAERGEGRGTMKHLSLMIKVEEEQTTRRKKEMIKKEQVRFG